MVGVSLLEIVEVHMVFSFFLYVSCLVCRAYDLFSVLKSLVYTFLYDELRNFMAG